MEKSKTCSLLELSEKTGIPPRTIRYYIAKNLLSGPTQVGRNAVYTELHLKRLEEIKKLKQKGLSLHEIALDAEQSDLPLPDPSPWLHFAIEDDIRVSVRSDIAPWRMNHIKKTLNNILPNLKKTGDPL